MFTLLTDICIKSIQCIHSDVNRKGIRCIRVITMKKNENISFRTDEETKKILAEYAQSKKWSISLLVEDIVQQWITENKLRSDSKE